MSASSDTAEDQSSCLEIGKSIMSVAGSGLRLPRLRLQLGQLPGVGFTRDVPGRWRKRRAARRNACEDRRNHRRFIDCRS